MAETKMPAAEAATADEKNSYEFAFHVLPTVAEGEVPTVFEALKALITNAEGEITSEEGVPQAQGFYEGIPAGVYRSWPSADPDPDEDDDELPFLGMTEGFLQGAGRAEAQGLLDNEATAPRGDPDETEGL